MVKNLSVKYGNIFLANHTKMSEMAHVLVSQNAKFLQNYPYRPNCKEHNIIYNYGGPYVQNTPQNVHNTYLNAPLTVHNTYLNDSATVYLKHHKTFERPPKRHGHADTDKRTRKTDSYGKDRHLRKRQALMEKTGIKHSKARFFKHRAQLALHV